MVADLKQALGGSEALSPWLHLALSHRSWTHEQARESKGVVTEESNERLEFLGDAVLSLVIAQRLYQLYPLQAEGPLSKAKARLVSTTVLARRARELGLGLGILVGQGERKTGGQDRSSLQADALEAVIGAVFMAQGWEAAQRFVLARWADDLAEVASHPEDQDPRTRLQEYCQKRSKHLPVYRTERASGPDHDRDYEIVVFVDGRFCGRGRGKSKKTAAQAAAAAALAALKITPRPSREDQ